MRHSKGWVHHSVSKDMDDGYLFIFPHTIPAAFLFQKKIVYTCTVIYKTFFNLDVWISLIPTRLCLNGYSITTHVPTCSLKALRLTWCIHAGGEGWTKGWKSSLWWLKCTYAWLTRAWRPRSRHHAAMGWAGILMERWHSTQAHSCCVMKRQSGVVHWSKFWISWTLG